jgi:hypothetical protein
MLGNEWPILSRIVAVPLYRLTKQSLRVETLERIEQAGEQLDRAALEVWSTAETHAPIREYLRRTLGKSPIGSHRTIQPVSCRQAEEVAEP